MPFLAFGVACQVWGCCFCFICLWNCSRLSSTLLQGSSFDGKWLGKATLLGSCCGSHFCVWPVDILWSFITDGQWDVVTALGRKTFLAKKCTDCMDTKALAKMLWMNEPDGFWYSSCLSWSTNCLPEQLPVAIPSTDSWQCPSYPCTLYKHQAGLATEACN